MVLCSIVIVEGLDSSREPHRVLQAGVWWPEFELFDVLFRSFHPFPMYYLYLFALLHSIWLTLMSHVLAVVVSENVKAKVAVLPETDPMST